MKIGQAASTGLKAFYGVVQLTNHCLQQISNQWGRQHVIWDRIEVTFISFFSLSFLDGMNGQWT